MSDWSRKLVRLATNGTDFSTFWLTTKWICPIWYQSDPLSIRIWQLQQRRLDISAKGVTSNFSLRSGQSDHWMISALNNLINVLSGWLARIFCLKLQINASLILMLSIIHAVLTCWFVVCQFYVFALWAWGQVSEQINVGLIWTKSWNKFCVWHTS